MMYLSVVIVVLQAWSVVAIVVSEDAAETSNSTENVWACLRLKYQDETMEELGTNMAHCARKSLYMGLVHTMDVQCVDVGDGVSFVNSDHQGLTPRERENIMFQGDDPPTFRRLIDGYSTFLSNRGLRWDLSNLYPGLVMKIGPTMNGAGILEFAMEKRLDYHDRSKLGPGQALVRRTILPHLLGFRMNLLSLLPIIFGIMIYVAKNAFIFSKITLILSTLLTLKSLFIIQHLRPQHQHHDHDFPDAGGGIAFDPINSLGSRPRPQGHSLFGSGAENFLVSMMHAGLPPFRGVNDDRFEGGQRNFAWERGL